MIKHRSLLAGLVDNNLITRKLVLGPINELLQNSVNSVGEVEESNNRISRKDNIVTNDLSVSKNGKLKLVPLGAGTEHYKGTNQSMKTRESSPKYSDY